MRKIKAKNKQIYYYNNSGKRISKKKYDSIQKGLKTRKQNKLLKIKPRQKAKYYYSKKGKRISKKKYDSIQKGLKTRAKNKLKYHYMETNFLSLWDIIKNGNEIFTKDAKIEWDILDYSFKGNIEENIANLAMAKIEIDNIFADYGYKQDASPYIWFLDDMFKLRYEGIEGESKSLKITITKEYFQTITEMKKLSSAKTKKNSSKI
jgi:hypothetical protein